jgi:DNA-directed RNA polymerase subunit K/omega
MPKKAPHKKVSNKEESDDEYDVEEDNDLDDVEEVEVEEFDNDEEETEEEKDDLTIEPEPETESGNCVVEEAIEDDNEYFGNDEETELPVEHSSEYVSKEHRVSSNRLTKYEMVRLLGERTKQLTMGAKPMIKKYQGLSYEKVAEEEFKRNMIPYKIKRPLPSGKFEIWTLDELSKDHLMSLLE